jgi:hypothetical protein
METGGKEYRRLVAAVERFFGATIFVQFGVYDRHTVDLAHWYRGADRLRRAALIHPELEKREPVRRPRFVTRHAPVGQPGVNFGCSRLDLFVGGEIETISLHRVYVWAVPEKGSDVIGEAYGHSDIKILISCSLL